RAEPASGALGASAATVHHPDAAHSGTGEVVGDAPAHHAAADDEDVPGHRAEQSLLSSSSAISMGCAREAWSRPGPPLRTPGGLEAAATVWRVRASLLGSLVVAISFLAGCRTTENIQRDYAKKITPTGVGATPVADTVPEKALRPMKVR